MGKQMKDLIAIMSKCVRVFFLPPPFLNRCKWSRGKSTICNPSSLVGKWIQSLLFGKRFDKSFQSGVWLQPAASGFNRAHVWLMHRSHGLSDQPRRRRPAYTPESMRSGLRGERWGVGVFFFPSYAAANSLTNFIHTSPGRGGGSSSVLEWKAGAKRHRNAAGRKIFNPELRKGRATAPAVRLSLKKMSRAAQEGKKKKKHRAVKNEWKWWKIDFWAKRWHHAAANQPCIYNQYAR